MTGYIANDTGDVFKKVLNVTLLEIEDGIARFYRETGQGGQNPKKVLVLAAPVKQGQTYSIGDDNAPPFQAEE